MVKISTRTGDDGSTGLLGSERVQKDSLRVEAFGALDECNAAIGIARSGLTERDIDKILEDVQSLLFSAGADLACPVETAKTERVQTKDVSELEKTIDELESELIPLRAFIHFEFLRKHPYLFVDQRIECCSKIARPGCFGL